jgi:hypothetical protein
VFEAALSEAHQAAVARVLGARDDSTPGLENPRSMRLRVALYQHDQVREVEWLA